MRAKIAISIDEELVQEVDRWVKARRFANRSQAMQLALKEKLARLKKIELAQECLKLDKKRERALADEGLASELEQWPDY